MKTSMLYGWGRGERPIMGDGARGNDVSCVGLVQKSKSNAPKKKKDWSGTLVKSDAERGGGLEGKARKRRSTRREKKKEGKGKVQEQVVLTWRCDT